MDNSKSTEIIMYGTAWCYDTRRARAVLDRNNVSYRYIDIDSDPEARKTVEKINHGMRSVPTIIFPDGCVLVEPSDAELTNKVGVKQAI